MKHGMSLGLMMWLVVWVSPVLGQFSHPRVKQYVPPIDFRDLSGGIVQGADGRIYASDDGNDQLVCFDGANWHSIAVSSPLGLGCDDEGTVWVGTLNGIGYVVRDELGKASVELMSLDLPAQADRGFYACYPTSEGLAFQSQNTTLICKGAQVVRSWVAGERQFIVGVGEGETYVVDQNRNEFFSVNSEGVESEAIDLAGRDVSVVVQLDNDRLLFWHEHILEVFRDGKFSRFSAVTDEMHDSGRGFFFVLPKLDGIVVGGHGEFLVLNKDGTLKYRLGVEDGIADSLIVRVAADRDGNLWLSHGDGISCVCHSSPVRTLGAVKDCFRISRFNDNLVLMTPSRIILRPDLHPESARSWRGIDLFPVPHNRRERLFYGGRTSICEIRDGKRIRYVAGSEFIGAAATDDVIVASSIRGRLQVFDVASGNQLMDGSYPHLDSFVIRGIEPDRRRVWGVYWRDHVDVGTVCFDFTAGWEKAPKVIHELTGVWLHLDGNSQIATVHKGRIVEPTLDRGRIKFVECELDTSTPDRTSNFADGRLLRADGTKVIGSVFAPDATAPAPRDIVWQFPDQLRASHYDLGTNQLLAIGKKEIYSCDYLPVAANTLPPIQLETRITNSASKASVLPRKTDSKSNFEFYFGVPSFNDVGQVTYRYRMNGLEKDFSKWSPQGVATYSRLPAGDFSFEVEAMRDGAESVSYRSRNYRIPRSGYSSPLAILGYVALSGLLCWLVVALRYRRLTATRRSLEEVVSSQTQQLKEQSQSLQRVNIKLRAEIEAAKESERQRCELEGRLRESERLEGLGQLAGGIAHDFNNLLAVVMSNAELLGKLEPVDEECREQIIYVANEAAELCRQMLMVSGGGSVEIEVHDLNEVVSQLSSLLSSTVEPLRLEVNLADHAIPILVDRSQLTQIVLNLVANAADAARGGNGALIWINTGVEHFDESALAGTRSINGPPAPGSYAWLDVRDEGSGIDPHSLRRMFDPFYSTKSQGRGLGLATVLRVVSRHNGALFVDSVVDKGTRIRVLLPLSTKDVDVNFTRPDLVPQSNAQASGRILLVDDDASIRRAVEKILRKASFDCVAFENGREAVDFADANAFQAAVVDLSMPDMGGDEVIRKLRKKDSEVPVVVISGFSLNNPASMKLPTYRTRYLCKPFSRVDLISRLNELLDEVRQSV